VKWQDFTSYPFDSYKSCQSWPWPNQKEGLNELWIKFNDMCQVDSSKDFLSTAIHWYIEVNRNSAKLEGSIIMAQTALELIYNWWIIENKQLLKDKDSQNISAANKLRIILSYLNIKPEIPKSFSNLSSLVSSRKKSGYDSCDAIVEIRNAIVHSQIDKRKKLASIDHKTRFEALELSIWYIELAILRILDYQGVHHNRTFKDTIQVDKMPWLD
jgi:hypothetical protein